VTQTDNPRAFVDICRRLRSNVREGHPDLADAVYPVAAASYSDPDQWQREMACIFRRVPLLLALGVDLPEPGDYRTLTVADRPVLLVRGDDGVVRCLLNVCRHRGAKVTTEPCGHARRFICPYHSWSYDRSGRLAGVPDGDLFGDLTAVHGLIELPCEERLGAVFAILEAGAALDLDDWLGDMQDSLEALRLHDLYPYARTTTLASPNWKLAADGYLDGYHIGFLHKDTIGRKALNNRNTYDLYGPHARIGFATRRITDIDDLPEDQWQLGDYMSLVHYVFPNVSISGGHRGNLMLSRLFPGPTVGESTTVQHHYYREPVTEDREAEAEARRQTYEQVVRDEDCATIFGIAESLDAMATSPVLFGRNEPANQRLHQTIADLTAD